jgi:hypothetical protein
MRVEASVEICVEAGKGESAVVGVKARMGEIKS